MNRWMLLIILAGFLLLAAMIWLVTRFMRFRLIRKAAGEKRLFRFLSGTVCVGLSALLLYLSMDLVNMTICLLHLAVIWLLADLAGMLIRRLLHRGKAGLYFEGVAALLFTALWLGHGWYTAHHVICTPYTVETAKDTGGAPVRIVMFADSHAGTTFHGDTFTRYVKEMEALNPDVLVIVGDFVDDDTSKEDMIACCEALGSISVRHGIYYVYGNHDRGYSPPSYRGYSGQDLAAELEKNGVRILQDETVLIDGRFYLIGREDAQIRGRASSADLALGLDPDIYSVVLDHEPHDYASQEKCGFDLVLSGHTHGGWLFPINRLSELTGVDDKVYGWERRSATDFIVTSGIAEWALKFKTGTVSEYVVIDVNHP